MMDFSILHVEHPTAERAGLGNNHPICIRIFQFDWRGDGIGAVLYIDERVFRHTGHPRINRQRRPITHQVGSPGNGRIKAL